MQKAYSAAVAKGSTILFFIQVFSTLSFGVLFSTLVLYATQGLNLTNTAATAIAGSFLAFNYALHLLGGSFGGRLLSYRALFCVSMLLQIAGCVTLSHTSTHALYWGLAEFLTGAGINVTCVNCMLTQLFEPDDKRRESAFLWNYSGMNIGFIIAFCIAGYFQVQHNFHTLFLLTAGGNVVTLFLLASGWKILHDKNTELLHVGKHKQRILAVLGLIIIALLVPTLQWLVRHAAFSNRLILLAGAFMALFIAYTAVKQSTPEARKKVWAYLILAFSGLAFWTLYQIMPMALTLFIEHNVDRHFLGFLIATPWVMNINSIVIIIGGPLLTVAFKKLRARGFIVSIPLQFSIALLLVGSGFALLPVGIHLADIHGYINFNWIVACYVLQSAGELFIGPIGYAMIGQLAPAKLQGVLMGTWMLTVGVAGTVASYFSNTALAGNATNNPLTTNPSFSQTFAILGWGTIICGIALACLIPFLVKLMNEKRRLA